jgi:DNA adenine methylase
MTSSSPSVRSPFRWAGSKRRLLPQLTEKTPGGFNRYVEPFAGSACLFFELNPPSALLSDINSDLILSYQQIQSNVEALILSLEKLKPGKRRYYQIRRQDPSELSPSERAARFIYLNRLCFNGLYRTNRDGDFNVPYGGERCGAIPSAESLMQVSARLKGVELFAASFEQTMNKVRAGDFVYLDPPYCIESRRVFNEYWHAAFALDHLAQLRSYMESMDKHSIPFLVSYGQSKEADYLAKGFRTKKIMVQRQIAGFVGNRRTAKEVIITNY